MDLIYSFLNKQCMAVVYIDCCFQDLLNFSLTPNQFHLNLFPFQEQQLIFYAKAYKLYHLFDKLINSVGNASSSIYL